MKTIRVYGDSFAVDFPGTLGWTNMLQDALQLPLINRAVSSSCTEYAIKIFVDDVENERIDDDIIIIVTSSLGRLNFFYQLDEAPGTANLYTNTPPLYGNHDWYWKNKDHIEWWMVNLDRKMQAITFESYVQLLKNFAVSKPNCTVMVLHAFDYGYNQDIFNTPSPKNFIRPNVCLMNISKLEAGFDVNSMFDFARFTKFTGHEIRANHLTNPNLRILTDLIVEAISTGSVDNFTYDKFRTNIIGIIKNKDEYLDYVNKGIIPLQNFILNNFK
jgi:hypothetical protein